MPRNPYYDSMKMQTVVQRKFLLKESNKEIAKNVGLSANTVAEYLKTAEDLGFYEVVVRAMPESVPSYDLKKKYDTLRHAVVTTSNFGLRGFGCACANYLVKEVFKDHQSITVGGGTNIFSILNRLPRLTKRHTTVYPMASGDTFTEDSSSILNTCILHYLLYDYDGKTRTSQLKLLPEIAKKTNRSNRRKILRNIQ